MARLRKKQLKPPDKSPHTYNQQPFSLDGRMDLRISFGERDLATPVYIKMDAPDPLLLSEGVCRQLGVVSYHQAVRPWEAKTKKLKRKELDPQLKKSMDNPVTSEESTPSVMAQDSECSNTKSNTLEGNPTQLGQPKALGGQSLAPAGASTPSVSSEAEAGPKPRNS